MGTKHKHAEVIKAWADGEEIELFLSSSGVWGSIQDPSWSNNLKYRVKPKNIVVQRHLAYDVMFDLTSHYNQEQKRGNPNIEYVFSPDGKLVSVEMIK